jgi:hypothetical protein
MGGFLYGLHSVTQESKSSFQNGEWLAIGMFGAMIVLYWVFANRYLDLPCSGEIDSIGYVSSLVHHQFYDLYNLSELLMEFRCNPPMVLIKVEIPRMEAETGEEVSEVIEETEFEYEGWRDITDVPVQLPRHFLVEFKCFMEYRISATLENRIRNAVNEAEERVRATTPSARARSEVVTPGFAERIFATTRGALPFFISFMTSDIGEQWRKFMLFIGYHSLLEAIWLILFRHEELTFRKELTEGTECTPYGEVALLDYQTWPIVV